MSFQLALVTRAIKEGKLGEAIGWGITTEDFTNDEARRVWELLCIYYYADKSKGSVMEQEVLHLYGLKDLWFDYPTYTFETLCYEVRRERVLTQARALVSSFIEVTTQAVGDPQEWLTELQGGLSSLVMLGTRKNTDTQVSQGVQGILTRIALAAEGVNLAKMAWPWYPLNAVTFGLQPDDYVVFYGRPKSMKTWVLCYLLAEAFMQEKKVCIYTKEMTHENVWMRTIACIEQFAYNELREATAPTQAGGKPMSEEGMRALLNFNRMLQETPYLSQLVTVLDGRDANGGDTVGWLESKVKQYKADILFVDGLYLLHDQRTNKSDEQRVRNISRDLRGLVLNNGVPVIATMQATRKAAQHSDAQLDEIAYSDALSQDCTIAARVIASRTEPTINIVLGGSREFPLRGFQIHGVPARNFSYIKELTEVDIVKAKEADAPAEDGKKKKPKKNGVGEGSTEAKMQKDGEFAVGQIHRGLA